MKPYQPVVILFVLLLVLSGAPALAQVPERVNYQARIVDGTGLVNGDRVVELRLLDAAIAGTELYAETQNISVVDGLYTFCLGASNSVPGSLAAALMTDGIWLETIVNGTTLSPREQIRSVSFALKAGGVTNGAIGAAQLSDGAALAEIADNDGPGSGLDADRLDGQEAAAFAPTAHGHDHGSLAGLGDDDHPQYLLTDGTRSVAGNLLPSGTRDLGSDSARWDELFLSGSTLHIGSSGDEATLAYNTATDTLNIDQDVSVSGTLDATMLTGNGAGLSGIVVSGGPGSAGGITDNSVTDEDLAANSVRSSEIANSSVTSADLAANSVGASEISPSAVDTSELANDAVNDDKIDFGTGGNQVSATDVPIQDAGGNFTATEVEAALAELAVAGAPNVFQNINTILGTDPAADNPNDTLSVLEGAGIDVTGNAAADSITIAVQPNSLTASELAANSVGTSELVNNGIQDTDIDWGVTFANQVAAQDVPILNLGAGFSAGNVQDALEEMLDNKFVALHRGSAQQATNDSVFPVIFIDYTKPNFIKLIQMSVNGSNRFVVTSQGFVDGTSFRTQPTPGLFWAEYRQNEIVQTRPGEQFFINVASGDADGEDFIVVANNVSLNPDGDLDLEGHIEAELFIGDGSMLTNLPSGVSDHGALTGLGDDDHPQYLLGNGAESFGGHFTPDTDDTFDLGSDAKRWNTLFLASQVDYGSDLVFVSGSDTGMTLTTTGDLAVTGAVTAASFSGDGSSLTGVSASDLVAGSSVVADSEVDDDLTISTSGSVADGALSANVSLLGASISDGEVDDNITVGAGGSVADGALGANVSLLGPSIEAGEITDGATLTEIADDDGTGSGLDADLLDGQEAAAFAAAGHNHDHGTLTGLGDDDHTQYLLADGTRALTGSLSLENGETIDNSTDETIVFSDGTEDIALVFTGGVTRITGGEPAGGRLSLTAKSATEFSSAEGGDIEILAGHGDEEGEGGAITLRAGDGDVTGTSDGRGGTITLRAGDGDNTGGGDAEGGDIVLRPGDSAGAQEGLVDIQDSSGSPRLTVGTSATLRGTLNMLGNDIIAVDDITSTGTVEAAEFVTGTNSTTYADRSITQSDPGESFTIDVAGGDAAGEDFVVAADNFSVNASGDVAANSYTGDGGGLVGITVSGGTGGGIADNTVTAIDLAPNSVDTSELAFGAVTSAKMASSSVFGGSGGTIADSSVTAADLAPNSVAASEIATDAVGVSELSADSVGASELQDTIALDAKLSLLNEDVAIDLSTLYVDASANRVGVKTALPSFDLHVNGTAGKPGGGSWSVASDIRLKTDVKELNGALARLEQLQPISFAYRDPDATGYMEGRLMGFSAQAMEKEFPEWVSTGDDGYKYISFMGFEAIAVQAVRELKQENEELRSQLDEMQDRLHTLERHIEGSSSL